MLTVGRIECITAFHGVALAHISTLRHNRFRTFVAGVIQDTDPRGGVISKGDVDRLWRGLDLRSVLRAAIGGLFGIAIGCGCFRRIGILGCVLSVGLGRFLGRRGRRLAVLRESRRWQHAHKHREQQHDRQESFP